MMQDRVHLIQFLMDLHSDFEAVRASLLHRSPLPTLESAISELISEETRLGMLKLRRSDMVLATTSSANKFCKNCSRSDHTLAQCPTVECRYCHKIGHILPFCPTRPPKPDANKIKTTPKKGGHSEFSTRSVATSAISTQDESSSSSPSLTLSDLENILAQLRGNSKPTPAKSALSGSSDGTSHWDRP
ncbi:unnamed protein product [Linum tenue]|uniref:CCHC-type domain-containing protein n=1 Tax=Linum tenue TaxID=586396 RepID=A0AAV0QZU5_9ROSI|nr:unnamed protein product [Linum tenue]